MGDSALQNRIDGCGIEGLLFACSPEKALQGEEAVMSVISASCAETRATVDLEDERYQWPEMTGNTAFVNSQDEMARLVLGASVTDSKGLHDKMQHTVIPPKGKERRVDIECLALKEWLEASSAKLF